MSVRHRGKGASQTYSGATSQRREDQWLNDMAMAVDGRARKDSGGFKKVYNDDQEWYYYNRSNKIQLTTHWPWSSATIALTEWLWEESSERAIDRSLQLALSTKAHQLIVTVALRLLIVAWMAWDLLVSSVSGSRGVIYMVGLLDQELILLCHNSRPGKDSVVWFFWFTSSSVFSLLSVDFYGTHLESSIRNARAFTPSFHVALGEESVRLDTRREWVNVDDGWLLTRKYGQSIEEHYN